MMAKDAGGDLLHIGVRTMCSYSPPPIAPAMKKHSSIRDDAANVMLMDPLADAPQGSAWDEASGAATRAGFGSAAEEKQHHQDDDERDDDSKLRAHGSSFVAVNRPRLGSVHIGADVAQPRIDDDRGHGGAPPQPLGHLQRRDDVGPGRSPGEDSFFAREPPSHRLGVGGRHRDDIVHLTAPPERWDKADADPLDLVRARRLPGEHGGLRRLHCYDLHLRVVTLQRVRRAVDGMRGADGLDKGVDAPPSLLP